MPIMFNTLLGQVGLNLTDVRLLKHKDTRARTGRGPYELWRDDRSQFELYQSHQAIKNRSKLSAPHWAVFVVNQCNETMFAGLYDAEYRGLLERDTLMPHLDGGLDKAGECDVYNVVLRSDLDDLIGRLFIDWGPGALAWVQYPQRHNKPVTELRESFREEQFPGFLDFMKPLSDLDRLPASWITALRSSRGVYLMTCPRTREQYVGSASGEEGFWGRWKGYMYTGHGNNKGMKNRDRSDYQVSILEVAGTSATNDDIAAMEGRWQCKLQSREMGLNRNLARQPFG